MCSYRLQSYYTEDKNSFVPVQEYCDAFVKHQGLNVGYRDLWNILKLAFPKVEKIRRGRKYVYWGIRRIVERTPKKSKKQAKGRSSAMNEEQTKGNVLASKTGLKASEYYIHIAKPATTTESVVLQQVVKIKSQPVKLL